MEAETNHCIRPKRTRALIDALERIVAQILGIAQELTRAHADQHPEAPKRGPQAVPRARRDPGNVPEPAENRESLEILEGDNIAWSNHLGDGAEFTVGAHHPPRRNRRRLSA